jgi:HD-GYP domain-containing protein (c-di-GMP phosphodiesterase class II)
MSLDPPNASPSPTADEPPADRELIERVRLRGAPLLEALESHLPGARHHAEATGRYAYAVAVRLGLDPAEAELCRETAKLHDVGMVYVPTVVTAKPFESWDAEEREAFDGHYEAGAQLARGAGLPEQVCGWLLRIRERFDGGGSEGLAGEAIPIAARIARAACACDTLLAVGGRAAPTPDRTRDTIARLRAGSGRELDPGAVAALARELEGRAA